MDYERVYGAEEGLRRCRERFDRARKELERAGGEVKACAKVRKTDSCEECPVERFLTCEKYASLKEAEKDAISANHDMQSAKKYRDSFFSVKSETE